MLPWFERCRDTGLPAAGDEKHPEGKQGAAPVLAKSKYRDAARDRMRELLPDLHHVIPDDLDTLGRDGWVAVVHADGNGVGAVFTDFARRALTASLADLADGGAEHGLTLDAHCAYLKRFAAELDRATQTAFWLAVRDTVAADAAAGRDPAGTILPVVVGGDDVTLVCHARLALALVRLFALYFEERTAEQPTLRALLGASTATAGSPVARPAAVALAAAAAPRLTAAAGIAYVKAHHPFSGAYALAEELTASAKRVKQVNGHQVSALDLHVTFESTLGDLDDTRAAMTIGGLPRHGGPYVITGQDSPEVGPRDIATLDRTMQTLGRLSSSMVHELREGLAMGPAEFELRLRHARRSPDLPDDVSPADIDQLAQAVAGSGDKHDVEEGVIVRLLDAMRPGRRGRVRAVGGTRVTLRPGMVPPRGSCASGPSLVTGRLVRYRKSARAE